MTPLGIQQLGSQIDFATESHNKNDLNLYLEKIQAIDLQDLEKVSQSSLEYFTSNIYATFREIDRDHQSWAWIQENHRKVIYHLRRALSLLEGSNTSEIKTTLKLQILTNLANALHHFGRLPEAIELYDQAIKEHSTFGMAIANRANTLVDYARFVQDGRQVHFLKLGFDGIKKLFEFRRRGTRNSPYPTKT